MVQSQLGLVRYDSYSPMLYTGWHALRLRKFQIAAMDQHLRADGVEVIEIRYERLCGSINPICSFPRPWQKFARR